MKCPSCDFVNLPDLAECKRCGHVFKQAANLPSKSRLNTSPVQYSLLEEPTLNPNEIKGKVESSSSVVAPRVQWWKEEATRKVNIPNKKRVARLESTSGLLRDAIPKVGESLVASRNLIEDGNVLKFSRTSLENASGVGTLKEKDPKKTNPQDSDLGSFSLDIKPAKQLSLDAGEVTIEQPRMGSSSPKMDVEIGSGNDPTVSRYNDVAAPWASRHASLRARLSAGLIDATVLTFAYAIFTGIFWLAGGVKLQVISNWIVSGFVLAFFTVAYFSLFTALRQATPGLIWMRLEVRSLDGGPPRVSQALWRGIGYLVSAGSLLLGFLWAVIDEDNLTWHDRISDTFLSPVDASEIVENTE